jgi:hypothetical protein
MNPDFKQMPRTELIAYVLAHREDQEAFEILLSRRSPDAEATWYDFPATAEGDRQMEAVFRQRINRSQ